MISHWQSFLQERSADWNLPGKGFWTFLLYNNYHPQCSNIDLLWFHNGSKFPRVVTKLCREEQSVKGEFENLRQVHQSVPMCVPKPLHFGKQGAFWALWMEGVPGSSCRPKDYRPSVLRSFVEMLAGMHCAIRAVGERIDPDRYRRMVLEPLQTAAHFSKDACIEAGCADLRARASAEWLHSLPVIRQHGDLFSGNVLADGHRWHIVDWESFGLVDLPFYDLLTFLISLLTVQGDAPGQWNPILVKETARLMECYAGKLGLSPEMVSLLLPLTLANWFHLQWRDGRKEFADRMYQTIGNYFRYPDQWGKVFLQAHLP
jgi:aminoglycoside phosphotransferase (APT) family kinase protein